MENFTIGDDANQLPENREIVTIDVSIDGKGQLYRDYVFTDGQAPEGIEDAIQDMVDTIISAKNNWKNEKPL
jgi:hypothetical protein